MRVAIALPEPQIYFNWYILFHLKSLIQIKQISFQCLDSMFPLIESTLIMKYQIQYHITAMSIKTNNLLTIFKKFAVKGKPVFSHNTNHKKFLVLTSYTRWECFLDSKSQGHIKLYLLVKERALSLLVINFCSCWTVGKKYISDHSQTWEWHWQEPSGKKTEEKSL